jgi:hypothetical protein
MKKSRQQILEEVRIHNSLLVENSLTDFIVSPEVRGVLNAAALAATIAAPFFPPAGLVAGAARVLQGAQIATSLAAAADTAFNPDSKIIGTNPTDHLIDAGLGIASMGSARAIQKAIQQRSYGLRDTINYRLGDRLGGTTRPYRVADPSTATWAQQTVRTPTENTTDPVLEIMRQQREPYKVKKIRGHLDPLLGRSENTNINRAQRNIDDTLKRLNAPPGVRIDISHGAVAKGSADQATKSFFNTISDEQLDDALRATLVRERPFRQAIPGAILFGVSQPGMGLLTPELGYKAHDRESPSILRTIWSGGVDKATRDTRLTTSPLPRSRGLLSPAQQLGLKTTSPGDALGDLTIGLAQQGVAAGAAGALGSMVLASRFRN